MNKAIPLAIAVTLFLAIGLGLYYGSSSDQDDPGPDPRPHNVDDLFMDIYTFWRSYRDPENGLYCDSTDFKSTIECGQENAFYSAAATGMGLVAEAIFTELEIDGRSVGFHNAEQTLQTVLASWPQDANSGFYKHFTTKDFELLGEYSTIDTAILVCGALFAGNYYTGVVRDLAIELYDRVHWSMAIEAVNSSLIWPVIDDQGNFEGEIRTFNEYFLVAYLAKIDQDQSPEDLAKAQTYFETFFGTSGKPLGGGDSDPGGRRPVTVTYGNYSVLSDMSPEVDYDPTAWVSSFIPHFCRYLSKGFHQNPYYMREMYLNWLHADRQYWRDIQNSDLFQGKFTVWGRDVTDRVFGCGAGDSPFSDYSVQQVKRADTDYTFSTHIMAGFLGSGDAEMDDEINNNLRWMYENEVCTYAKTLLSGARTKVLWRCSVLWPDWRADRPTAIDFSTMLFGYATNFLDDGFFEKHAP